MQYGAFRVSQAGGPEQLEWIVTHPGAPGTGEIRIRHEAIGVNYLDVYQRSGSYPLALPTGIGVEGCGIVEAVGEDVSHLREGDRVVYAGGPPGAYATHRLLPAFRAVRLPDGISPEIAASLFFKGLTTQYLIKSTFAVQPGQWVLFHAAAGGVGTIAMQWLRHIGANVIAIVSSAEKAEIARANGATHVIINTDGEFAAQVKEIIPQGVHVVYDSVGKTTFMGSLDSLRQRGLMVSFGMASGPIPPTLWSILGPKGSLYFTRPTIAHYMATHEQLVAGAADVFEMIAQGVIKPGAYKTYKLQDAVQAHKDLESRGTTGSLLLIP